MVLPAGTLAFFDMTGIELKGEHVTLSLEEREEWSKLYS